MLSLLFPTPCITCGAELPKRSDPVCLQCLATLPETGFAAYPENTVEKLFRGRLNIQAGMSLFYFSKGSSIQKLLHAVKYKNQPELARYLGRMMGEELKNEPRFGHIEAMVPLPLYRKKERQRGYNQSDLLCEGIQEITGWPILKDTVIRPDHSDTQTRKGRLDRWENISGKFRVMKPEQLENKPILLVDDVLTTGATLDACGNELLSVNGIRLSLAVFAFAAR